MELEARARSATWAAPMTVPIADGQLLRALLAGLVDGPRRG